MIIALVTLVAGYLLIVAAAYLFQSQLMYFPFRSVVGTPDDVGLAYEEVWLKASDGNKLLLWHIPHPDSRLTVIYFHGNADNISTNLDLYQTLHELQAGVIAVEYRGYSGTPGKVSECALELDLVELARFLNSRWPPDSMKFVGMGRSLGGAVAVKLSQHMPLDGMILESTFNSMTDIARRKFPYLPVSLILTEAYDSESILKSSDVPVVIIHSPDDEIVPFELATKLFSSARGPKKLVEIAGGHNSGVEVSRTQLQAVYVEFLGSL